MDREKAETEARAKMTWGEDPNEVKAFLVINGGFSREEAAELVDELIEERAADVRGMGIRKIIIGSVMMSVPVVAWMIMWAIGVIYLYALAAAIFEGLWGLWILVQGIRMVAAPKAHSGDLADDED